MELDMRPTDCVGYLEADVIATREYPGIIPMFAENIENY